MDTFSSDSITNQTGMTKANLGGLPRRVDFPVELPRKFNSKHKKKIKEISKVIYKLAEVLNKIA